MSTATCTTMMPALGATVTVRFQQLHLNCTVKDIKNSYGQPRLLIAPISGSGEQWIEMGRIVNPSRSNVKFDCCPGVSFHSSNRPMIR
ncbi:MAG: hypothetical protein ABSE51_19990 [Terracidiphilus sp.]